MAVTRQDYGVTALSNSAVSVLVRVMLRAGATAAICLCSGSGCPFFGFALLISLRRWSVLEDPAGDGPPGSDVLGDIREKSVVDLDAEMRACQISMNRNGFVHAGL